MSVFHILNGDCLAENFPADLDGERIIWRECLMEGPLSKKAFFENRAKFIKEAFIESEELYEQKVLTEHSKIRNIPKNSEVYFWFEDDLFCQVNFWFLLSQFTPDHLKLFAVFPIIKKEEERWKGFGNHDAKDLEKCFTQAKSINYFESQLGQKLWNAFSSGDLQSLKDLSKSTSQIFRKLEEVIIAHQNRFNGTLESQISEISKEGSDFGTLFNKFSKEFGIYGFGDLQFQRYLS